MLDSNGNEIPRRAHMERWSVGEAKIFEAIQAVETMGADVRLTEAVILLGEAKDKVADFVDREHDWVRASFADVQVCSQCGQFKEGHVRDVNCSGAKKPEPAAVSPEARAIAEECDAIKAMLLQKNAAYGNSAFAPVRIFSKADPVEQLLVRLDDKLSRLARGSAAGEDTELDLMGYLVLLRVARRLKK